jgi:hypothetical protein
VNYFFRARRKERCGEYQVRRSSKEGDQIVGKACGLLLLGGKERRGDYQVGSGGREAAERIK